MIKFNHLWYLLHICCDFAIIVNPFFRAVKIHLLVKYALSAPSTKDLEVNSLIYEYQCLSVGPLPQSAERGADNAKVVSSTLTRTNG